MSAKSAKPGDHVEYEGREYLVLSLSPTSKPTPSQRKRYLQPTAQELGRTQSEFPPHGVWLQPLDTPDKIEDYIAVDSRQLTVLGTGVSHAKALALF